MNATNTRASRLARGLRALLLLLALSLVAGCSSAATGRQPAAGTAGHPSSTGAHAATRPHTQPLTLDQVADTLVARMSFDDQLGQLMLVALTGTDYSGNNAQMIEQQHVGGILLYTANMATKDQTVGLIATAQQHAPIPLLVITDEEGGFVDRLTQFFGHRPSATDIGNQGSYAFSAQQGAKTGADMRSIGFNADFAPDVDVQLVDGPDQSTRTFGTTPDPVARLGGAYLNGLQSAGIIGCIKHFPGLGAATTDAHQNLPVINRSRDQIEAVELAPYRALIATGQVQMIMATDLLMPALDPTLPAELSPAIMTGVLRDELGYNGVVVTDALYMQGVSKLFDRPEAAVRAIIAGDDLLVGAFTVDQVNAMEQALRAAVASGRLTRERIAQSVHRILVLKMRAGLLPVPAGTVTPQPLLGTMTPVTAAGALTTLP